MTERLVTKGPGGSFTQTPYQIPPALPAAGLSPVLSSDSAGVTRWALTPQFAAGFENFGSDSVLAMSGTYLTIRPLGLDYTFFVDGVPFTKTSKDAIAITDDLRQTYVWFDSAGTLQSSTSMWTFVETVAPVCTVYKDGSNYAIANERHGYQRPISWHEWGHDTIGARYSLIAGGLTGTFTNTTLSITQGTVLDEDLHNDTGSTRTSCRLWYRHAGAASMDFESGILTPYKAIAGVLQYDNLGTLTPLAPGEIVNSWVYATNDIDYPIYVIVGQAKFSNQNAANGDTAPVLPLMTTLEWKLIYRVSYKQVGAATPTYQAAFDMRLTSTGPSAGVVSGSHAALTHRDAAGQHPITSINAPTANTMVYIDANGDLAQTAATTNWQILQGVTGNPPALTSTPQFPRIGIGAPADGTIPVYVASGIVGIGDNENTKMATGLTINDGGVANTNEMLTLKGSDVSIPFTNVTEADTFFRIHKYNASGIAVLEGFTDNGSTGLLINSYATQNNTDKTTTGSAPIQFSARKSSGANYTDMGADANIFCARNNTTTLLLVDAEGQLHINEASTDTWPTIDCKQSSTGDVGVRFGCGANRSYMLGIDNDASTYPFKISTAASATAVLGTSDIFYLTAGANLGIGGAPDFASVGSTYDYWTLRSTTAENYGMFQIVGAKTAAIGAATAYMEFGNNSGLGGTMHRMATISALYDTGTGNSKITIAANSNVVSGASLGSLTLRGGTGYLEHSVSYTGSYPYFHLTQANTGDVGIDISVGSTRTYGLAIDNSETNDPLVIATAAAASTAPGTNNLWKWFAAGNCQSGPDGAAATNATDGFLYVRCCAGAPVGVPTSITGYGAVIIDSTNHQLYFNDGSGWVAVN